MYNTVVNESCTHRLSSKTLSKPSSLLTQQATRSLSRKRSFPNELPTFQQRDIISTFQDLTKQLFQKVFSLKNQITVYYISIQFPTMRPNSRKYQNLFLLMITYICSCNNMACHYFNQWFVQGLKATLKKISYLENFPVYIRNTTTDNYNKLLNELNQRNFYKPQGRPPYSLSMIRYAFHLP